jgi:hypothetical protein
MPNEPKTLETLPITPPLDANAIATKTGGLLDRLERAARNARLRVKDIPPTFDAALSHVDTYMRAEAPPWARQRAVGEARQVEQTLDTLAQALTDARAGLTEHEPALRSLAEAAADCAARSPWRQRGRSAGEGLEPCAAGARPPASAC